MPDKIIILELTKEELEYRLSQKEQDSIEKRGSQYLLDIQSRMIEAINMINTMGSKQIELIVIDAKKSIEDIEKEIQVFLEK